MYEKFNEINYQKYFFMSIFYHVTMSRYLEVAKRARIYRSFAWSLTTLIMFGHTYDSKKLLVVKRFLYSHLSVMMTDLINSQKIKLKVVLWPTQPDVWFRQQVVKHVFYSRFLPLFTLHNRSLCFKRQKK